jgi:hypothetical protein
MNPHELLRAAVARATLLGLFATACGSGEVGGISTTTGHRMAGSGGAGGASVATSSAAMGGAAGSGGGGDVTSTTGSGGVAGAGGQGSDAGLGGSGGGGSGGAGPWPDGGVDTPIVCMRTVPVSNNAELGQAASAAMPGDCIVLADGNYTMLTVKTKGTASLPIVFRAANRSKAVATAGDLVLSGASYTIVEGLSWNGSGNVQVENSDHCRISRFTFRPMERNGVDWIVVTGTSDSTRVDHNDLGPKKILSNMVMLSGEGSQVVQHTRIDHNYFHDVTNTGGNGWESIRAGLSGLALSSGYSIIEYNLFERAEGDPETISMKSSDSIVRYNTFRATPGEITLRHGNRNLIYGNFMLGGGNSAARGIRVCGQDHKLWNNYIQDITASPSILLEGGDSDAMNQAGTAHYRVYRAQVVNNTVVNSDGIDVGGGHQYAPVDCVIANNIVQGSSGAMIGESRALNPRYLGNMVNPLGGASVGVSKTAAEIRRVDPQLVKVGDIYKLSPTSPAINAATGDFPFVTDDMDGQLRMAPDVGADESSAAPELIRPLTQADVGPNAP